MTKKIWILGRGKLLKNQKLGPITRFSAMAEIAQKNSFHPIVVLDSVSPEASVTFETMELRTFRSEMIEPGSPVILNPHLPWKVLIPLILRKIPFDLDSHGIGALEAMESESSLSSFRRFQGRRRYAQRMRLLLHSCERVYVSIPEQAAVFGGMLFRESRNSDISLSSRLPAKTIFAPMGIHYGTFPEKTKDLENKNGRPIFLWGGGIWSWFDIPTLIQAFKILKDQGNQAILYFLTDGNPSGLSSQDKPVQKAKEIASALGLLNSNVFFHPGSVSPEELPRHLKICRAGILSNPATLESLASWRTRLLDLLWAGKPAIVSGNDPLSSLMQEHGCATIVSQGDSAALAAALAHIAEDDESWRSMCKSATALGSQLDWNATLNGAVEHWKHWKPQVSFPIHQRIGAILRCLAGF